MRVAELMITNVHACDPDDTLKDAARQMWSRRCGALVVVDREGGLLGLLTDRDVAMAAYKEGNVLRAIDVADAMTRDVPTVEPHDTAARAAELMALHRVRRLPVLDAQRKVVGLVSLTDLAREAERAHAHGERTVPRRDVTRALAAAPRERTAIDDPSPLDTSSFSIP